MSDLTLLASGTYSDLEIKPVLDRYRQVVAQRYTPCPPSDLSRLLAAPPFYVSQKIDGELWFLVKGPQEVQLVAANGRVLTGNHEIFTAAKSLPSGAVLAGELHVARPEGRERVGDVRSALASSPEDLIFSVFDILLFDGSTWQDTSYVTRLELMQANLGTTDALRMIPVALTESESEVHTIYQDLVEKSAAEGIIVRCSDGRALKVKPELTVDCAILGFTSRLNANGEEEARSLLLGLSVPKTDSFIVVGTVGNMSEAVDRRELLNMIKPSVRPSQYRQAASSGQLYQMVEPELVVECKVMDVQVEDSKGRNIKRPLLTFVDNEWSGLGITSAGTLLNPIATRIRTDKSDVIEGSRITQISDYLQASGAESADLGTSEILTRRVWVKEAKEKTDVRKLLIWKTNKEQNDDTYPAFVVHWTDYSAGRKSPLTREVRPASSLDAAQLLAEGMIEANIKKGWAEVVS